MWAAWLSAPASVWGDRPCSASRGRRALTDAVDPECDRRRRAAAGNSRPSQTEREKEGRAELELNWKLVQSASEGAGR